MIDPRSTSEVIDQPKYVYVCAPFRNESAGVMLKNVDFASNCGRWLLHNGQVPIVPHLLTVGLFGYNNDAGELNDRVQAYNKYLIDKCDAIYVFGPHVSDGMQYEVNYCKQTSKPVFFYPNFSEALPLR